MNHHHFRLTSEERLIRKLNQLKLEVGLACDRFWSRSDAPPERPKFDPGAGHFTKFHRVVSQKAV